MNDCRSCPKTKYRIQYLVFPLLGIWVECEPDFLLPLFCRISPITLLPQQSTGKMSQDITSSSFSSMSSIFMQFINFHPFWRMIGNNAASEFNKLHNNDKGAGLRKIFLKKKFFKKGVFPTADQISPFTNYISELEVTITYIFNCHVSQLRLWKAFIIQKILYYNNIISSKTYKVTKSRKSVHILICDII